MDNERVAQPQTVVGSRIYSFDWCVGVLIHGYNQSHSSFSGSVFVIGSCNIGMCMEDCLCS